MYHAISRKPQGQTFILISNISFKTFSENALLKSLHSLQEIDHKVQILHFVLREILISAELRLLWLFIF